MQLMPELVIRKVIAYLDFNDIVNMRLSCSTFYKYSHCKEFYQGVNISPINLSNRSIPSFASLMSNGGRFLKLNLQNVQSIKSILPYIHDVANISINVKQLQMVTENCQDLKRLEIQLHSVIYSDEVISFSCLESLGRLNELHIKGIYGKHISGSNIFNRMQHTRFWKFIKTKIYRNNLPELPTSVASLTNKCESFNKFYFSQLGNEYFINPAHIEPNLKVVELSYLDLRDGFERNGLIFPNVEILKLKGTIIHEFFLQNFLSCCKFTLKEVTLDGILIHKSLFDCLKKKCNSLQKLTLRNINCVSRSFLETLKAETSISVLIESFMDIRFDDLCKYICVGPDFEEL